MKKFIYVSLMLIWTGYCSCSCSSDDDTSRSLEDQNSVTVSESSLSIPEEGAEVSININAKDDWQAYVADGADWLSVSPKNGHSGNADILISVASNNKLTSRDGQVIVKCGGTRLPIAVNQAAHVLNSEGMVIPEGYTLVWNDEFDNEDVSKDWTFERQPDHWVNNELQTYVGRDADCCQVTKDGILKITAVKDGSRIKSTRMYACAKTGWQYGYFEARIQLPKGHGTWPAFWMMPTVFTSWPACGEIDIMEEVGNHPNYVSSSLHALGHYHANNTQITKEILCPGAEDDFHIYACEWTKDYFQFYVDGQKTLFYENDGKGEFNWPYDQPFYVILNLAWGGDWGGAWGVNESDLPVTMQVDYVRVFQKK